MPAQNVTKAKEARAVLQAHASPPLLVYETSYGSPHYKVDPWPGLETCVGETADDDRHFVWIRLAIGYDTDIDEVAIEAALKRLVDAFRHHQQQQ